jgi:ADP-ribose pyrophosphatase YjhB (NUDIX family)
MTPDDDDSPVEANHKIQHQFPYNVRFCALCGGEMRLRMVLPDRKRHKVCSACGFIDFPGPKLVAGCLVIQDRRVLLIRRGIAPAIGKWTFPGGYVDLGETPQQAAVRETVEEVGMKPELGSLLGVFSDPANPIAATVVYLAKPGSETPGVSDEATEVRYCAADEIPWNEIAFHTTTEALRVWIDSLAREP